MEDRETIRASLSLLGQREAIWFGDGCEITYHDGGATGYWEVEIDGEATIADLDGATELIIERMRSQHA